MLSIQKNYLIIIKIIQYYLKEKKIGKCNKLICGIHDKENYVDHIKVIKQALNYGLILKTVHKVIQFNQEAWMKPYIDMNTEYRKKNQKKRIWKRFLMINSVFGKTMEKVRKHRDIKLVAENLIIIRQNAFQKIWWQ